MSTEARPSSTSRPWAKRPRPAWAVVAAATAGALLLVLLLRANAIVVLMHSNADLASPLVIAEEAHRYPDAQIATGRLGWWGGLWVLQALRPLPGNSYLGSYLPMVVTVLVAVALALQARRLWGRLAPWVVLVVALGVGAETWANLAAWSSRAPSWWAMGLVGVVTVASAGARSRRTRIPLAVAAVLVLLWTAIVASGDQEAMIALLPLAACGLYALRVRRPRLGAAMLVAAAATFGLGRLVATLAEDAGYLRQSFPVSTTTFDGLGDAFANLLLGLQDVWRGPKVAPWTEADFATTVGTLAAYLGMAVAVVAVGTVLTAAARAWRGRPTAPGVTDGATAARPDATGVSGGLGATGTTGTTATPGTTGTPGTTSTPGATDTTAAPAATEAAAFTDTDRRAGAPASSADADRDVQRGLWATFWAVGLLVYLLAFAGTTAGGTLGEPVVRYLYGVPMAAAAALAPLAARRRPWALTAAVVALGVITIVGFVAQRPEPAPTADASNSRLFRQIGAVTAAEGVTRGYAGYWTAYPLVLQSGFKLDVSPVARCGQTPGLCTMYLHYIDRAYEPRPGIRSFLVVDGSAVAKEQFSQASVTDLPPNLKPTKVAPVGDGVYVAFFDHDIAADLEPNRGLGDPRMGKGGPLEPLPSQ